MSTPYESTGRTRQKARTRDALLAAARACIADGVAPTVEAAAERAAVSRTTAYRYFPDQHALLGAAHPESVTASMLSDATSDDPADRLDQVVTAFTSMVAATEAQQRTMLRLALQKAPSTSLPLRQGRAIQWLTEAIEPIGLPLDEQRRLVLAVRSATGIESLVWLTDVAGLSRDEALDLMRWSAQALLAAALATRTGSVADHPSLSPRVPTSGG